MAHAKLSIRGTGSDGEALPQLVALVCYECALETNAKLLAKVDDVQTRTIQAVGPTAELFDWSWVELDDVLENPIYPESPHGWFTQTEEEHLPAQLLVYEAAAGKRAHVSWGSMMIEGDARSWEEGKSTCEVMIRHLRACNAELSR